MVLNLLNRSIPSRILAVTRDTQSSSAQELAQRSSRITLVEGNLDEPAAIFKRAKELTSVPVWGVFSVQVRQTQLAPTYYLQ